MGECVLVAIKQDENTISIARVLAYLILPGIYIVSCEKFLGKEAHAFLKRLSIKCADK